MFASLIAAQEASNLTASSDDPQVLVQSVIAAAGGRDKLLKTFKLAERYNVGAEKAGPGKSTPRNSILQPPKIWTVDGRERGEEPAKFVVWAWTLGMLNEPATKLQTIPGVQESGKTTRAIRASGTVTPAMDLHFDAQTFRLIRIDWRDDIYRFSDWREHDGTGFPAQTAIWKKKADKPWFFHEVLAVERLAPLP
jgi:hypothetical protein